MEHTWNKEGTQTEQTEPPVPSIARDLASFATLCAFVASFALWAPGL